MKKGSIATSYRPQQFKDVVGQGIAVSALKNIAMADGIPVKSIFLKGSFGSGKCISVNERIHTNFGYVNAEQLFITTPAFDGFYEVKSPLAVLQPDGTYANVSALYYQKNTKCLKIHSLYGSDTIVTPEHPLMVHDGDDIHWIKAKNIKPGMKLVYNKLIDIRANSELNVDVERLVSTLDKSIFCKSSHVRLLAILEIMSTHTLVGTQSGCVKIVLKDALKEYFMQLCDSIGLLYSSYFSTHLRVYTCYFQKYLPIIQSFSVAKSDSAFHQFLKDLGMKPQKRGYTTIPESHRKIIVAYMRRVTEGNPYSLNEVKMYNISEADCIDHLKVSEMLSYLMKKHTLRCRELDNTAAFDIVKYYRDFIFSRILTIEEVESDVYDVSVPTTETFISGGRINHNTTLSRIFGKAVNCETFKKIGEVCDPSNPCKWCQEVTKKNSQHYLEYDSTRIGTVDQIRDLDLIFSMPPVSGRRVITVDESATISRQAQNALLKVLEEGVKNTFMVFASTDPMIQTIMSRSLVLDITTIPLADIKQRVRAIAEERGTVISEEYLDLISLKSDGHMRNALSLLELYEIAGPDALKSSVKQLKQYFMLCLTKKPVEDIISEIMLFPIIDIKTSLSIVLRDFFISEESFDKAVRQKGMAVKIFNYFYSPASQEALRDEYGIEILLRAFAEMLNPTT